MSLMGWLGLAALAFCVWYMTIPVIVFLMRIGVLTFGAPPEKRAPHE